MTSEELRNRLFANQDFGYKKFHQALIPGVSEEKIIGVRVPCLRKLAKEFASGNREEVCLFMGNLPHDYFEENQIHFMMIQQISDFDECLAALENFLPYVDNWAVCDGKNPKVLLKNETLFLRKIREWLATAHPYQVRFGINMLMNLFLEERFDSKYLEWVAAVNGEKFAVQKNGLLPQKVRNALPAGVCPAAPEYYVKMGVAWYFATALSKQWDAAIPFLTERRLDAWTHNKTIQKARESFRITGERKEFLQTLRIPPLV